MRFIAPLILILIGALIGIAINKWVAPKKLLPQFSAVAGCAGAFLGLIARDVFDIVISNDSLVDALLGALIGAFLLSLAANLAARFAK